MADLLAPAPAPDATITESMFADQFATAFATATVDINAGYVLLSGFLVFLMQVRRGGEGGGQVLALGRGARPAHASSRHARPRQCTHPPPPPLSHPPPGRLLHARHWQRACQERARHHPQEPAGRLHRCARGGEGGREGGCPGGPARLAQCTSSLLHAPSCHRRHSSRHPAAPLLCQAPLCTTAWGGALPACWWATQTASSAPPSLP